MPTLADWKSVEGRIEVAVEEVKSTKLDEHIIERKMTRSGAKAYQREDREDREMEYREWHRTLDKRFMCFNIDNIEWRFYGNVLTPVAVIETTRYDYEQQPHPNYLKAIVDRYNRELQGKIVKQVALALNVNAYIVLFRKDLSEFWVYDLSYPYERPTGWIKTTKEGYVAFLGVL